MSDVIRGNARNAERVLILTCVHYFNFLKTASLNVNVRYCHSPEHITQMAILLLANEKGFTTTEGSFIIVEKMPDYGQLSGRSIDGMVAGARAEIARVAHPADLCRNHQKQKFSWDISGRGRPGWHIERSARQQLFSRSLIFMQAVLIWFFLIMKMNWQSPPAHLKWLRFGCIMVM